MFRVKTETEEREPAYLVKVPMKVTVLVFTTALTEEAQDTYTGFFGYELFFQQLTKEAAIEILQRRLILYGECGVFKNAEEPEAYSQDQEIRVRAHNWVIKNYPYLFPCPF